MQPLKMIVDLLVLSLSGKDASHGGTKWRSSLDLCPNACEPQEFMPVLLKGCSHSVLDNYLSQTFTTNFFLKLQNEKTVNMLNERTGHS